MQCISMHPRPTDVESALCCPCLEPQFSLGSQTACTQCTSSTLPGVVVPGTGSQPSNTASTNRLLFTVQQKNSFRCQGTPSPPSSFGSGPQFCCEAFQWPVTQRRPTQNSPKGCRQVSWEARPSSQTLPGGSSWASPASSSLPVSALTSIDLSS
jgi:hypothetical protein